MITKSTIYTLIAQCDEEIKSCLGQYQLCHAIKDEKGKKQAKSMSSSIASRKEDYYRCIELIDTLPADEIKRQRDGALIKLSTIEDRCYKELGSRLQKHPDMKNKGHKAAYDAMLKEYSADRIKKQLKNLNFILQ